MEMLNKAWQVSWSHIASHLSYFSGISILIPVLGDSIQRNIAPWIAYRWSFLVAIALMFVGVAVIFWLEKRIGKMMQSIGWMMFIPGVLAIVFSFVTSQWLFNTLDSSLTGFSIIEPGVEWLVHHAVPNTVNIGALYVLIGIGLVWIGKRMGHIAEYL